MHPADLGNATGGGRAGHSPRDIDGCPEAGDDNCPQMWAFWSLGLMLVAPRLGATGGRAGHFPPRHTLIIDCHTWVWDFWSSGLMTVAPRLGTLFATWVWAFGSSGLMAALRLGTSFATRVWTFPSLWRAVPPAPAYIIP